MIFVFGTIWFWLLVAAAVIIITVLVDEDSESTSFFGPTATLVAFLGITCFLGNFESFKSIGTFIIHNPTIVLGLLGIYVVLGIIWSFVKWYFYLLNIRDKHIENDKNISPYEVSYKENKGKILLWMCYWPFSALWTMLKDPVRRVFQYFSGRLSTVYQGIADRMFKEIFKNKSQSNN